MIQVFVSGSGHFLKLAIVLIMLGNGMHFTLIGCRGWIEGFFIRRASDCHLGLFHGFSFKARALTPFSLIPSCRQVAFFAAPRQLMSAGLIAFSSKDRALGWCCFGARGFLQCRVSTFWRRVG